MNSLENQPKILQQPPSQEALRDLNENEALMLNAIENGFREKEVYLTPNALVALKKSLIDCQETKIPVLSFEARLVDGRSGINVTLPANFKIYFDTTDTLLDSERMTHLQCDAEFSPVLRREEVTFRRYLHFKDYEAAEERRRIIRETPKPPLTLEEKQAHIEKEWRRSVIMESDNFRKLVTKLGRLEGPGGFKMFGKKINGDNYKEVHNYNNEYSIRVSDNGDYLEIYRIDIGEYGELEYTYFAGYNQKSPDFGAHQISDLNQKISELGIDFQYPVYPVYLFCKVI
jgi:hypothetical protein